MVIDLAAVGSVLMTLKDVGVTALAIWYVQRKFDRKWDKQDEARKAEAAADLDRRRKRQEEIDEREAQRTREQEEREKKRDDLLKSMLMGLDAVTELTVATAKAVQRIPDAHCNGDMHAALDYVDEQKKKQRDLMAGLMVDSLSEGGSHEAE